MRCHGHGDLRQLAFHGAVSRFRRDVVKALQSLAMWSATALTTGQRTTPGDFSGRRHPNFNCLSQLSAVIVIQTTGE
jgi:hypothetical protein